MIKCSKCYFENEDDANFCSSCGKPLDEEKAAQKEANQQYECPKCGHKFVGKPKWCSNCGLEFKWPEENMDNVPIKVRNQEATRKTTVKLSIEKAPKEKVQSEKGFGIFDIIAYGVTLGAILFALIGVWLDSTSVPLVSTNQSFGVSFWFNELWKLKAPAANIMYGIFALFILAALCVIGFGIVTIIKSIIGLIQKRPYNLQKWSVVAIIPVIVYFATFRSTLYTKSTLVGTKMGSGYILTLISVIFLMIAIIGYKIVNSIKNKNFNIAKAILESAVTLFVLLALVIVPLAGYKTNGGEAGTLDLCLEIYSLERYSSACEMWNILTMASFFAFVILLGITLIQTTIIDLTKANNVRMSMISTAMAVGIFSIVAHCCLFDELGSSLSLSIGFAPILSLIFVVMGLGCLIAKVVLDKKENN